MSDFLIIGKVTKKALHRVQLKDLAINKIISQYKTELTGVSSVVISNVNYEDKIIIRRYFRRWDNFTVVSDLIGDKKLLITFWSN